MFKKLIFTLLFSMLGIMASVQAASLKQANDLYAKGDFSGALTQYQALLDSGFVSGALCYNLGNAYYKTGNLAAAILNFERAKLYIPKDKDLNYNLEMAQRMVVDKIDRVDVFFLNRWIVSFGNNLSSDQWAVLGIICFIVILIGLMLYSFSSKIALRKFGFVLGILMLLSSAISFAYSYTNKRTITERKSAIIFSPTVTVKGSPDESGTELFILHEGTKVNIIDSLGEWNEIQLGDGNVGWLKGEAMKKI